MNTPFTILMCEREGRIVLTGTLDGSPETYAKCEEIFRKAGCTPREWIIDATQVLLPSGGALNWINAVHEFMRNCKLTYVPCQLASVLQLTERYRHPHSKFLEEKSGVSGACGAPRVACA